MSTDALDIRTPEVLDRAEKPVVITGEQIDLIKATIAADATDAELALFFYDCRRRGVHPLDKLIHFTKRKGKYTPVTSIDFFRSRAASTREHMGTEDAVFSGDAQTPEFAATVTVYRLVQGEKCPFTATARWSEYCPEDEKNAFMWLKMPHGQLAKCAEALALRKGFPQELENLHTFEEMDQNAGDPRPHTMQAPQRRSQSATSAAAIETTATAASENRVTGKVQQIEEKKGSGKKGPWTKWTIRVGDKDHGTFKAEDRQVARQAREAGLDVTIEFKTTEYGRDIVTIAEIAPPPAAASPVAATQQTNGQLPIDREPGSDG